MALFINYDVIPATDYDVIPATDTSCIKQDSILGERWNPQVI